MKKLEQVAFKMTMLSLSLAKARHIHSVHACIMQISPVFIAFIKMILIVLLKLHWQKEVFTFCYCIDIVALCYSGYVVFPPKFNMFFSGSFCFFLLFLNSFVCFCLFQVAWIWHQLQGSELLGKSFQASMKNCFKIYRTCLIHLGIWQNIVMSLTAKTYSPPLSPCFLLSKKTLHSFMKVKAEVPNLLSAKED